MDSRIWIGLGATMLVTLGPRWTALRAQTESPPPSALVNQRAEKTLEAARALSPRTNEESLELFQEDVDAAVARAIERVWDPTRPREPSPRTRASVASKRATSSGKTAEENIAGEDS